MNPHNSCVPVDPPGAKDRRWRCTCCGVVAPLDDLMGAAQTIECTYVYPPCRSCGETPTCAPDCAAILRILSSPGLRVIR